MKVIPYQVRKADNWMYLVIDDATKEAAVVDPWDHEQMSEKVKEAGVKVCFYQSRYGADRQVTSLITTHHHQDHSGGNEGFVSPCSSLIDEGELIQQLASNSGVKAYGGSKKAPGTDKIVKDGDSFKIGENINVK